jgi:hypothetical protein
MPTWKKVIVSGSNISQLSNDAGYLTSVTAQNSFVTMSVNGVSVLADSAVDTLTFASSSGAGLNIVGDPGADSITFTLTGIPGSSLNTTSVANAISSSIYGGVSGDILIAANGAATIQANSVALGTDTTGNYVQSVANGTGITAIAAAGEGSAVTVSVSGASSLNSNRITKWTGTAFADSSLTDNGTTITGTTSIQLSGASSSLTGSFTGSFAGSGTGLTGVASSTVNTTATTTNADHYLVFVDDATSQTGETLRVDSGIKYNPSTDTLTVEGNLFVNGTTVTVNTADLYVEDKFIVLASGSATDEDGGIMVDRGSYTSGSIAFGYDAGTDRWGYQNGLSDTTNAMNLADGTGTSAAFAGIVFTQASHGATKPITGEFAHLGATYIATNEDIWIYS